MLTPDLPPPPTADETAHAYGLRVFLHVLTVGNTFRIETPALDLALHAAASPLATDALPAAHDAVSRAKHLIQATIAARAALDATPAQAPDHAPAGRDPEPAGPMAPLRPVPAAPAPATHADETRPRYYTPPTGSPRPALPAKDGIAW